MKSEKKTKKSEPKPEVYSVKKGRREFLNCTLRAGASTSILATTLSGCFEEEQPRSVYIKSIEELDIKHENGDRIFGVGFAENGKYLVSNGRDQKVHIWSRDDGDKKASISGKYGIDWFVTNPSENSVIVDISSKGPSLYSIPSGNEVFKLDSKYFDRVFFSPDGKYIVGDYYDFVIWSSVTGKEVFKSEKEFEDYSALCFGSDSKTLYCYDSNNVLKNFSIETGEVLSVLDLSIMALELPFWEYIFSCEYSTNETNSTIALTQDKKNIEVYSLNTGQRLHLLKGIESKIKSFKISPSGKLLAAIETNGLLKIWSIPEQKLLKKIDDNQEITSICFSADSLFLAASCNNGFNGWPEEYDNSNNKVRLWKIETEEFPVYTICSCDEVCSCNTVSPNNDDSICACNTVNACTCNKVCSCNEVCSCDSNTGGGEGGGSYWHPN